MENNGFYKKFNLESLFLNSPDLRDNEKEFLSALAQTVNASQNDFFRYLEKHVVQVANNSFDVNPIYTLMLRENDVEADGFYSIIDTEEEENTVFVECRIDEVEQFEGEQLAILNGNKEIKVNLRRATSFVEKESLVFNLFKAYGIHIPCIYSPYARRAFVIENEDINLKRDKIVFKDKRIFKGILLWNLEVTPSNKLSRPKEVSVNGQSFIRFDNSGEDGFIIVDGIDSDVCFIKEGRNGFIDMAKKDYDLKNFEFSKIVIKEVKQGRKNQFSNVSNREGIAPSRIRTKADIHLAIEYFYEYPIEFITYFTKTNNNTIKDYPMYYKYDYSGNLNVGMANKNFIYLQFQDSKVDLFFEDRVNFFISFMRYNYPEFYWVGVK